MNTAVLLQSIQLAVNLIFIPIFMMSVQNVKNALKSSSVWFGDEAGDYELLIASVVLGLGLVNILLCFGFPRCRKRTDTTSTSRRSRKVQLTSAWSWLDGS